MAVEIVVKDPQVKSELNLAHFKENCRRYHDVVCDYEGDRPEIIVLCGSTRFYDEYQTAYYELTMTGYIVLSVGFYPHAVGKAGHGEGVGHSSEAKDALDELHKRKIDLADSILVISDTSCYYGSSTRSEIKYARARGKPVHFTQSVDEDGNDVE